MGKKKHDAAWHRKRMRRRARLADAREWLSTHRGANVVEDYARWYGVDLLCTVIELRRLGEPISEERVAQVRADLEQRARERTAARAAQRANKHATSEQQRAKRKRTRAKQRALLASDIPFDLRYGDESVLGWPWTGDGCGAEEGRTPSTFDGDEDRSLEYELLADTRDLQLRVIGTQVVRREEEIVGVRLILTDDPAQLAKCGWGLIYAIGMLSFADADADLDFAERDRWRTGDMLRCLSFEQGRLRFHADEVRGRCMRTTVEIDPEGKILIETAGRGEAALRWISKLRAREGTPGIKSDTRLEMIPF
jgi:hypothetical protein